MITSEYNEELPSIANKKEEDFPPLVEIRIKDPTHTQQLAHQVLQQQICHKDHFQEEKLSYNDNSHTTLEIRLSPRYWVCNSNSSRDIPPCSILSRQSSRKSSKKSSKKSSRRSWKSTPSHRSQNSRSQQSYPSRNPSFGGSSQLQLAITFNKSQVTWRL